MKTRTVTEYIGEDMGPVDWSHPMAVEFAEKSPEMAALLKEAEQHPEGFLLVDDHGWYPRQVYRVCMYDGWPYWKPTPAVLREGPLGSEWTHFNSYGFRGVRRKETP